MKIVAIVAMDEARIIGNQGQLPWHLPEDLKRFSKLTRGHIVLMGRKTYESLPPKSRPLPQRRNLVVTRNSGLLAGEPLEADQFVTDLPETLRHLKQLPGSEIVWVIGGAEIYQQTLPHWDEVALTLVPGKHKGDARFPKFENQFELVHQEAGEGCEFRRYVRCS